MPEAPNIRRIVADSVPEARHGISSNYRSEAICLKRRTVDGLEVPRGEVQENPCAPSERYPLLRDASLSSMKLKGIPTALSLDGSILEDLHSVDGNLS